MSPPCHEFKQEAASREVFELTGRSRPIPELAEFAGKAIATP